MSLGSTHGRSGISDPRETEMNAHLLHAMAQIRTDDFHRSAQDRIRPATTASPRRSRHILLPLPRRAAASFRTHLAA